MTPHIADVPESWPVDEHRVLATGRVCSFVEDRVSPPEGPDFTRQYLTHPGAVAVIALDEQQRVAVLDQYRHPVAMRLVEPPAGLLDVAGEDFLVAAKRELAEEALLQADDWRLLVDIASTPGGCDETIRIYLARGLAPAPRPEGFVVADEEAHMSVSWAGLEELVDAILDGRLGSPSLVSGVLALRTAIALDRLDALRPADAPWPARQAWQERRAQHAGLEEQETQQADGGTDEH